MSYFLILHIIHLLLLCTTSSGSSVQPECDAKTAVDVMLVLDITLSMKDDLELLRIKIPQLVDYFQIKYPGSRFGLTTFNWKPSACQAVLFEEANNYCAQLESGLVSEKQGVVTFLNNVLVSGGSEAGQQDALGGMVVAARSRYAGWERTDGMTATRFIVVLTDDKYSEEHQYELCMVSGALLFNIGFGNTNDGIADYDCETDDFPSYANVKKSLEEKNIVPIFLVTSKFVNLYKHLLKKLNLRSGSVAELDFDSANVAELITSNVAKVVCEETTYTTTREKTVTMTTEAATEEPILTVPTTEVLTTTTTVAPAVTRIVVAAAAAAVAGAVVGLIMYRYVLKSSTPIEINCTFEGDDNKVKDDDKNLAVYLHPDAFA